MDLERKQRPHSTVGKYSFLKFFIKINDHRGQSLWDSNEETRKRVNMGLDDSAPSICAMQETIFLLFMSVILSPL